MKVEKMLNLEVSALVFLVVGTAVFAGGGVHLQQQQYGIQGSYSQPQAAQNQPLESAPASEVEYVDGPLAPLYDFLIQRRLHKFCKLLRDAGLEEVLKSLGGYWTLFVPTDASFIFLPGGTLENLKRNPQSLRDFILYHFVTGNFPTSQIQNEMLVDSVQGSPLRFNIYGQIVTVSGAQIVEPDLEFELGRVHIIDHPLYPIPTTDTASYLRTSHQRLYRLLLDTNLLDYISSGTFTILAPNDDAFDFLSSELKDALATNRSLAERVLLNHILPGSVYTGGIVDGMQWQTVGGADVTFTTKRGLVFANGIPVVLPDVPFTNGVIHALNRVLLPEGVDADCHCKPSTSSPQQPAPQNPGNPQPPPFGRNPQPPRGLTTRRPNEPFNPRLTPRPFGGQGPGNFIPGIPRQPAQQTQRPFSPSRTGQTTRPVSSPVQITRSPYDRPVTQTQPEIDSNIVVGPALQPAGGQKKPDQTRTTRYPTPPRHVPSSQNQRVPQHPGRPQPQTIPDSYPEQDISHPVTSAPRQTTRWTNRQPTQVTRYPTRGNYRTPSTTRRPQTTRSHIRVTPPTVGKVPNADSNLDHNFATGSPQQEFSTQKPTVRTTSWQQRRQVTQGHRQTTHQRTTSQPSRLPPPPPPPQRRPTPPRPGSISTASVLPAVTNQPFESNRQTPNCRRRGDRLTPATQNLPICSESGEEPCQKPPYSPSDPRPLCPIDIFPSSCRGPNEPYNPSDNRPPCPPSSPVPGQGCRIQGQSTYVGDRRPLCSPAIPKQTGCRDSSAPFNPSDNRPLCSTTNSLNNVNPTPATVPSSGCRRPDEPTNPQDRRPVCTDAAQGDCRSFLERPKPGDRRPLCKINQQTPQQRPHDTNKGQRQGNVPPLPQRPTYPQNNNRFPNTQTTRRNTWQSTTKPPQTWQPTTKSPQTNVPDQQLVGKLPPASGSVRPLPPSNQPQRGTFQTRPQPPSRQPQPGSISQPNSGQHPPQTGSQPAEPHTGSNPVQPQTIPRPGQPPSTGHRPLPPSSGVSRPYPTPPQTGSRPVFVPQTGSRGPYPQVGNTPTPPQSQPFQTPSYPNNQPNRPAGTSDIRPNQPFTPQRRPVNTPHQQGVTSFPGRGTSSPRVPVSVTGTSTTPGEDTRRTLYEIVEDPALLIRGQPVKLTKIFSLFHKAGIEDVLSGPGPITVFLPSDDAFATLPKGVIDQLEENPELLRQVLMYHITNSEILPSAQGESYTVPSMEGDQLVITMNNGGKLILISGAKAIAVTRANNGIFYVINQLLYPLPHANIVGAIQSRPDLSTLSWLLSQSGLSETLQGQTPFTLLAPTDNAFAQLPPAVLGELTENSTALQQILLNHIVEGAHYGREFITGVTFPSARGGKLKFQVVSYGYQVNDINIKTPEIVTGSGVIHLIDQVLLEDSDLRFFNSLDNSVSGPDDASLGNQQPPANEFQPFQPPPSQANRRPGSGQLTPGGQRLPQGQQQPTGILPPLGQHTGQPGQRDPPTQRPSGGKSQGYGPLGGQSQGHSPLGGPSQGHNPVGGQSQGHSPLGGQSQGRIPLGGQSQGHSPLGGQSQGHSPLGGQSQGHNPLGGQSQGHSPLGGQSQGQNIFGGGQRSPVTQPNSFGHPTHGGRHPPSTGTSSVGQRQPSFQPQNIPVVNNDGGHQANVADLARAMGLNKFANWVTNTGLLEKIHDGGVYTVFAPTDEAVNSLPQDMANSIDSDPQQTKSLLQYHIVPRRVNINSVSNDETSSTLLQGKTIRFNVYQSVQPDCKQLVTASGTPIGDALATMGSIQVIPVTQVLYEPTGNLLNIIDSSPILQDLSQAIKSARLNWILSGTGPLTFFAPSDTAFRSLSPEERKNMIDDKQAFSDLLKKHMIRGTYFSSGVQQDLQKNSDNNQPMTISLQGGILTVNSVPVTYSDITATNGVLHVVDQFL